MSPQDGLFSTFVVVAAIWFIAFFGVLILADWIDTDAK